MLFSNSNSFLPLLYIAGADTFSANSGLNVFKPLSPCLTNPYRGQNLSFLLLSSWFTFVSYQNKWTSEENQVTGYRPEDLY